MTTTFDPPNNDKGWAVDDFRDADGKPPAPADDEDLRGYQMRPEAADAFRAWWATQGYTPQVLDSLLTEDPVSADAFLDKVNRAIRKQRALRYGTNG
jgi:hypothetical protein